MAGELKVLQIGSENWSKYQEIPENMDWYFFWSASTTAIRKVMKMDQIWAFDIVLVDRRDILEDLEVTRKKIDPYTIFYDQDLQFTDKETKFLEEMCAFPTDFSDREALLNLLSKAVFRGQYGDKLFPEGITVHPSFKGKAHYFGNEGVELSGDFGADFRPVADWNFNIMAYKGRPIELWLEYEKDDNCDIQLVIRQVPEGSVADIVQTRVVSEEELQEPVIVEVPENRMIVATLEIKGQGWVKIGNLHQRFSRFQFGQFLLGGGMLSDAKRQEITYYFHPGDLKPPLTVYFSGFRPAEGFEGFFMMKNLGTPFLLFSDPRLLGGAFYMGSDELEDKVRGVIQQSLDRLSFTSDQLILSGMSMGTYPSMYYGADFEPAGIVMAKTLANVGTIAQRNRLLAPTVFDTGVDVLHLQTGGLEDQHVQELNQKFWTKFNQADFSKTTFGIAYMKDEDMDPTAFEDIVQALYHSGAKILRKGTAGRHNDDTDTSVIWFLNFYHMILESKFGRK